MTSQRRQVRTEPHIGNIQKSGEGSSVVSYASGQTDNTLLTILRPRPRGEVGLVYLHLTSEGYVVQTLT